MYAYDAESVFFFRRMRPFTLEPCDFWSVHETFVMHGASLNRDSRYGWREYLMGRLVSVTGQGQVIFLLCGDHSDGGAATNCECVQNGGTAFISIKKETFSFRIIYFFQDFSSLHFVIKAEREGKKVLMWSLQFTKQRIHPSIHPFIIIKPYILDLTPTIL